ncbi:hypothetical protein KL86PLE_90270 [uncultured Pleomorphomonas sp.]|uniref:Uncharacterized protein n=1 Tax=uncultured Pleomorphomonas sp. TaxID=442121 RepID=A0A212LNQ7_9HYPH|nr:hypothetical protein KL86PLE_90270 [uncultured Pleomorphomonas sp.]
MQRRHHAGAATGQRQAGRLPRLEQQLRRRSRQGDPVPLRPGGPVADDREGRGDRPQDVRQEPAGLRLGQQRRPDRRLPDHAVQLQDRGRQADRLRHRGRVHHRPDREGILRLRRRLRHSRLAEEADPPGSGRLPPPHHHRRRPPEDRPRRGLRPLPRLRRRRDRLTTTGAGLRKVGVASFLHKGEVHRGATRHRRRLDGPQGDALRVRRRQARRRIPRI